MEKQPLTLQNILHDLRIISKQNKNRRIPGLLCTAIMFAIFAVLTLIFLPIPLLIIAFLALTTYYTVRYLRERKDYADEAQVLRAALNRANISISIEKFSHVGQEYHYEPYTIRQQEGTKSAAKFFYFSSGNNWRMPLIYRFYAWSKTHYLTYEGLQNISLAGDEFFYISLQGSPDISFIYPCKLFTLAKELEQVTVQAVNE